MYKRILCAIDLEDMTSGRKVLARARALSEPGQTRLMLLHVLRPLPLLYAEYLPADFDAAELKSAKQRMTDLMVEMGEVETGFTCTARRGTPYVEVLNEAAAVDADLIIIGSHQPSFASKLLGSNAASIVRHSTVDVLIARNRS